MATPFQPQMATPFQPQMAAPFQPQMSVPIPHMAATIQQLTQRMDSIMRLAVRLPDGRIEVSAAIAAAEAITATLGTDPCIALNTLGFQVDRQQYEMLKCVVAIEKSGPRISMEKNTEETFPLGMNVEGGIVDDIKVTDKVEFDVVPLENGSLMLSNVRGIVVEARDSERLKKHVAKLSDITISKDAMGQTTFNARLTNPEKWWERMVTGHHNSHVGVSIRLGSNGQIQIHQQQ